LTSDVKTFDEVALYNKGFRDLSQCIVNQQRTLLSFNAL